MTDRSDEFLKQAVDAHLERRKRSFILNKDHLDRGRAADEISDSYTKLLYALHCQIKLARFDTIIGNPHPEAVIARFEWLLEEQK